ncbi:c-type cytochrome [Polaribacter sp. R77954]|uniref:c-type cytochrome n=1 Tax=Polaribacter sp. R77954 TaxID=3093870 RepID=UPI0037C6AC79
MRIIVIYLLVVAQLYTLNITRYLPKAQNSTLLKSVKRGKKIYTKKCKICHKADGKGKINKYPPLAQSDFLVKYRAKSIRAIKFGITDSIVVNGIVYHRIMKKVNLNHQEIADVMNYISNSWGNKNQKIVTAEEVVNIKKD